MQSRRAGRRIDIYVYIWLFCIFIFNCLYTNIGKYVYIYIHTLHYIPFHCIVLHYIILHTHIYIHISLYLYTCKQIRTNTQTHTHTSNMYINYTCVRRTCICICARARTCICANTIVACAYRFMGACYGTCIWWICSSHEQRFGVHVINAPIRHGMDIQWLRGIMAII